MPFREAHGVVGALVRAALAGEGALVDLVTASPELGAEAAGLLAPGASVHQRTSPGGGAPEAVVAQLARADERLRLDQERAGD